MSLTNEPSILADKLQAMNVLEKIVLAAELGCKQEQLSTVISTGNLISAIRKHFQMSIYTVNDYWKVQLFDFNVSANDAIDCIYETGHTDLNNALIESFLWRWRNDE